ncbi:glycosyltransferase family 1 protein [Leptolyngbya sp. FACHB-671]|uniref:glycosyltransferase n=1 Tax=Leptolyngbya sp. FACHB-671 TaxID=2692812 RepID=UPI001683CB34|nr:glycosyltransferase [Leptolyngbya sp. FACHB-671]MBD2067280.1 glycosyltransferase family 1 protein [Leptolyngbya sp. FACHB-671]
MARITILTVGSRGDIQPFCAIALGLIQSGHQVTLASSPNFADFAAHWNIPFIPIAGDFKQLLSSPTGLELLEGNRVKLIPEELLWQQLLDAWNACHGADLIVFSPLALWGYHLAEALKVPAILATQIPIAATRTFPFLGFTERTDQRLPGLANLLSYHLVGFLGWRSNAKLINRFRQDVLHLPQLPWAGARYRRDASPFLSPLTIVNCYSAAAIAPPSDWGPAVYQAGYCFLNTADSFTSSPKLQAFLDEEPKPFYVGFGSMIPRHPEQLAQTIVSALATTKQRAILCSGWGSVSTDLSPSIYRLEEAPHDWLFPRVSAAIHHGGSGTVAATLRAGIPSIVVPFFGDQPTWGNLLVQLGVCPATHRQSELTSDRLVASIQTVLEDSSFRERAQQLQVQLQAEDGVARVVSVVESQLQR